MILKIPKVFWGWGIGGLITKIIRKHKLMKIAKNTVKLKKRRAEKERFVLPDPEVHDKTSVIKRGRADGSVKKKEDI